MRLSRKFFYTLFSVDRDFYFSVCSHFCKNAIPDISRGIPVSRYRRLFGPAWFAIHFRIKFKIELIESLEMSESEINNIKLNGKSKWIRIKKRFDSPRESKSFFIFHSLQRIKMNRFGPITDSGVTYPHLRDVPIKLLLIIPIIIRNFKEP